jgi:hypothetical protein
VEIQDVGDARLGDVETGRNLRDGEAAQIPYLKNLVLGEQVIRMFFTGTPGRSESSFRYTVLHVLAFVSHEQMGQPKTRRIVASVENVQPHRNRTFHASPDNPRNSNVLSLDPEVAIAF